MANKIKNKIVTYILKKNYFTYKAVKLIVTVKTQKTQQAKEHKAFNNILNKVIKKINTHKPFTAVKQNYLKMELTQN